MPRKILQAAALICLVPLSFLTLIGFNQVMIYSSGQKVIFQILNILFFAMFCILWLVAARLMKDRMVRGISAGIILFILAMLLAFTYIGQEYNSVTVFVRQYLDYVLIWIGVIAGFEISALLAGKNSRKS